MLRQSDAFHLLFAKGNTAKEDIPVSLMYQPHGDTVLLAWDIYLAPTQTLDTWSVRIDAKSGRVLEKNNLTLYCHTDEAAFAQAPHVCEDAWRTSTVVEDVAITASPGTGGQYKVWAPPLESPLYGPRTLVTNPADPVASPLGWHDINGLPGADFTITRGMRIAQIVFAPVARMAIEERSLADMTDRGAGGFGSTGTG